MLKSYGSLKDLMYDVGVISEIQDIQPNKLMYCLFLFVCFVFFFFNIQKFYAIHSINTKIKQD